MNEIRLMYKFDTGEYPDPGCDYSLNNAYVPTDPDYVRWLEERILDDEALFILMNAILHEKNKTKNAQSPDQ
jgi:hypothetical protein